jgi:hypothetical protein
MSWRVEYLPATGVVEATAKDEVSDADARAQVEEAIRLVEQHQASLVLADYAEALSEVTLPSLYELPDLFNRHGGLWHIQIAVVTPRTGYRIETYQFFGLVCRNAGYNVKLFATRGAAEEWLEQGQSHRPGANRHSQADAACLAQRHP